MLTRKSLESRASLYWIAVNGSGAAVTLVPMRWPINVIPKPEFPP